MTDFFRFAADADAVGGGINVFPALTGFRLLVHDEQA